MQMGSEGAAGPTLRQLQPMEEETNTGAGKTVRREKQQKFLQTDTESLLPIAPAPLTGEEGSRARNEAERGKRERWGTAVW